jgi:hypothetical protein
MPIDPAPLRPMVSEGHFITAAYGYSRRVGRRTVRRLSAWLLRGRLRLYARLLWRRLRLRPRYYRPAYGHYRRWAAAQHGVYIVVIFDKPDELGRTVFTTRAFPQTSFHPKKWRALTIDGVARQRPRHSASSRNRPLT